MEESQTNFSGGIADDPRFVVRPRHPITAAQMLTNFDATSFQHKLVPYRASEDGDSDAAASQKRNFCVAYNSTTSHYHIYGLGIVAGQAYGKIMNIDLGSLGGNTWSSTANNQLAGGSTFFNTFVYFHKVKFIYGINGQYVFAYDPSGTAVINPTALDLLATPANTAQGVVHPKTGNLYIPYDNKIAVKLASGTTATDVLTAGVMTFPADTYITSISPFGEYLAVACAPLSGVGNSTVYMWDMDATSNNLTQSIDWGEEVLKVIGQVDGILVGISVGNTGNSTRFTNRIVMRYLSVSQAIKFKQFLGGSTGDVYLTKQNVNNRLWFAMKASINDTTRTGIWSVGRDSGGGLTLVHERTPNNDTAVDSINGFLAVGDYVFISHLTTAGSVYGVSVTNDQANTYTATAYFETKIFDGGNISLKKKLIGVTVYTEPLPSNGISGGQGQVTVKYKKDSDTSYTTIFTQTATDTNSVNYQSQSHPAINIESTGANLPEFKEISFSIESKGGAVITGFSHKYEVMDKKPY